MSNGDMIKAVSGELVNADQFDRQTKQEIDMQVSTAKRFPRSITSFKEKALSLATLDEETAAGCHYSLPRKDRDGTQKNIEGPSIRLAEIIASSWGNLRVQAAVVDDNGTSLTARGTCWDLETNVAISKECRRRVTYKNGSRYSDDMVNVTANAACSIAMRNAILAVIPQAIAKTVYDAAYKTAFGNAATFKSKLDAMIAYYAKLGIGLDRVLKAVDCKGVDDVTMENLATLRGIANSVKDGEMSLDEAFPVEKTKEESKPDEGKKKKSKTEEMAEHFGASKPKGELFEGAPDADEVAASFLDKIQGESDVERIREIKGDIGACFHDGVISKQQQEDLVGFADERIKELGGK